MVKLNDLFESLYIKTERVSNTKVECYVSIQRYILMEYTHGTTGAEYGYSLKKAFTSVFGHSFVSGKTPKEAFKKAYGKARRDFKRDAMSKMMI